jgi:hypothetical protein
MRVTSAATGIVRVAAGVDEREHARLRLGQDVERETPMFATPTEPASTTVVTPE